uniref:Uncharacterized protein n=1 Tax=Trichobilharzia regenti TaxID=157069 RepID=A0AA85KE20_TRIRE|nr:unnamed protein product [Trichobilharzia regenti]
MLQIPRVILCTLQYIFALPQLTDFDTRSYKPQFLLLINIVQESANDMINKNIEMRNRIEEMYKIGSNGDPSQCTMSRNVIKIPDLELAAAIKMNNAIVNTIEIKLGPLWSYPADAKISSEVKDLSCINNNVTTITKDNNKICECFSQVYKALEKSFEAHSQFLTSIINVHAKAALRYNIFDRLFKFVEIMSLDNIKRIWNDDVTSNDN